MQRLIILWTRSSEAVLLAITTILCVGCFDESRPSPSGAVERNPYAVAVQSLTDEVG